MKDTIYRSVKNPIKPFEFNEEVADVFPDMILRSVPGYPLTISMISVMADKFYQSGSNIYDLGCSLGTVSIAIQKVLKDRKSKIIAVDNSEAMIKSCCKNNMVENDENVPDAYSNAQQMKEIAEISYNVNNDPLYEDIKKQFDYNQIVIDPKNFGDKLPATETAGSTSYQLKDYNSSEDPDYQHNKIYHNYEDGNFYIFNGTGNGSFILVTLTKE